MMLLDLQQAPKFIGSEDKSTYKSSYDGRFMWMYVCTNQSNVHKFLQQGTAQIGDDTTNSVQFLFAQGTTRLGNPLALQMMPVFTEFCKRLPKRMKSVSANFCERLPMGCGYWVAAVDRMGWFGQLLTVSTHKPFLVVVYRVYSSSIKPDSNPNRTRIEPVNCTNIQIQKTFIYKMFGCHGNKIHEFYKIHQVQCTISYQLLPQLAHMGSHQVTAPAQYQHEIPTTEHKHDRCDLYDPNKIKQNLGQKVPLHLGKKSTCKT